MKIWKGKKINLRAIEPEDYKHFYESFNNYETQKFVNRVDFPQSLKSAKEFCEKQATKKISNHECWLVIEDKEKNIVGNIDVNDCDPIIGSFKYGIEIDLEYRKKGYAEESIKILLNYFFNYLRFQKANAEVYSFNESSIKLQKKLGFLKEGQIRNSYYAKNKYYDTIHYGITKDEFNSKWNN